ERVALVAGEQQRPGAGTARPFAHATGELERAGAEPLVGGELDLDGAEEAVALVAGVLAGSVGQLAAQVVLDLGEPLVVGGADAHLERVGRHRAPPDVDRSVVVHLAREAAADLDRAQAAAEHPGEGALDQVLELALEALQAHGGKRYPGGTPAKRAGGPGQRAGVPA